MILAAFLQRCPLHSPKTLLNLIGLIGALVSHLDHGRIPHPPNIGPTRNKSWTVLQTVVRNVSLWDVMWGPNVYINICPEDPEGCACLGICLGSHSQQNDHHHSITGGRWWRPQRWHPTFPVPWCPERIVLLYAVIVFSSNARDPHLYRVKVSVVQWLLSCCCIPQRHPTSCLPP